MKKKKQSKKWYRVYKCLYRCELQRLDGVPQGSSLEPTSFFARCFRDWWEKSSKVALFQWVSTSLGADHLPFVNASDRLGWGLPCTFARNITQVQATLPSVSNCTNAPGILPPPHSKWLQKFRCYFDSSCQSLVTLGNLRPNNVCPWNAGRCSTFQLIENVTSSEYSIQHAHRTIPSMELICSKVTWVM